MSMGEDWIAEHAFDTEEHYMLVAQDAKQGIWYNKDGQALKISEMKTGHIRNCLSFIQKISDDAYLCYVDVFEEELKKRGAFI